MKFKLSADPEDWLIFVLMLIVMLYLVAIAVLNFSSLIGTGEFHGLNPIPAFTNTTYLMPTIVFYIVMVLVAFGSVNSYFFDRDKGVGITTQKSTKGYATWTKAKDLKKELKPVIPSEPTSKYAGIPLINDGKTVWVDDGEYHNLILGSTGSGKTQIVVFPMVQILAKKGESMIITDPKGEIYEKTGEFLKSKGYKIIILNLRDPQRGNAWNPFQLPLKLYKSGNSDKATELLDDLAINILYDEKSQADPFWEKSSADYFTGLALGLFEDTDESRVNLNSINYMSTVGEDRYAGSTYIKEYFELKDPTKPAYINASSTINAPTETKGSILSVFRQKIKLFSSKENLSEMLSHSDFDMQDIGKEKTAVFIVIQDEKKTYHPLATIFLKQVYETLIDVAQQNGGRLPVRTNFILDEFANMPPLKDVTTMITAARSRQIRFSFIIQNFAQLTQVYGKENAETIKGNCGNIVYLISTELQALEEISKLCGEVKSKEKDKTSSTPLVTITDLQTMKQFEIIVKRLRFNAFKTKMTPNFKMNWGIGSFKDAVFPTRDRKEVNVFDLKEFVKEKKNNNLLSILEDSNKGGGPTIPVNPFMMNTGDTPFNPLPFGNNNNDYNIDDIVKKIDEKIAELEKEEAEEKKKQETVNEINKQSNTPLENKTEIQDENKESVKKTIPPEAYEEAVEDISDDQFFDDFFAD